MATLPVQKTTNGNWVTLMPAASSTGTLSCTSIAWLALSFIAPKNPFGGTMRLQDIRIRCGTATGSPKITACLYADSASAPGEPGTLIETGTESAAISSNTYNTFGGFTTTSNLTEGTMYWVVLKCTSGTSLGFVRTHDGTLMHNFVNFTNTANTFGFLSDTSADSGSSWGGSGTYDSFCARFGITDGTDSAYFGICGQQYVAKSGTGEKADGTIKFGFQWTTPADAKIRVKGITMYVRRVDGGSVGDASIDIYQGTSVVATSNAIPHDNISTSTSIFITFQFSTPYELSPSTAYRFMLKAAAGAASTDYYYTLANPVDTDASTAALLDCYFITHNGSSFDTISSDHVVPAAILIDSIDPYGSTSGAGLKVHPGMNGGMNG